MIKPTMSHAMNQEHLNELLVRYYENREKEKDELRSHLHYIRSLICDACEYGFNPLKGEWAEKLFKSNQRTSELLGE